MGGIAVSAGAENQAGVAAFIGVRMLLEWRLNWSPPSDDVPFSVSGEVGGPGDDLQISFGTRRSPIEAQCKRALTGRAGLLKTLRHMLDRLGSVPSTHELALVLGAGSSSEVRDTFAADIRRFRSDRKADLRPLTLSLLEEVPQLAALFDRLYVVSLDVGELSGNGTQQALDALRSALAAPAAAEAAWAILVREGLALAQAGTWARADVVALLRFHKLDLQPVGTGAAWLRQLDYARTLNKALRPRTAAGVLEHLARELRGQTVPSDIRRQLHGLRGSAAWQLGDRARAAEEFERALDFTVPPNQDGSSGQEDLARWLDARHNFAASLSAANRDAEAESIVRDILKWNNRQVLAWGHLALLLNARSTPPALPPADLRDAPDYRDALARIAVGRGDWAQAASHYRVAFQGGDRPPTRLVDYARTLINLAGGESSDASVQRNAIAESERVATEAIELLQDAELESALGQAFFVRGVARERLNRADDAAADFERAARLAPTDANVVLRAVSVLRSQDRGGDALAHLTDSIVESSPLLGILRAEVRTELNERELAASDLRQAIRALGDDVTGETSPAFLSAIDVAIDLGLFDAAQQLLASIRRSPILANAVSADVVQGRLEAARGNWEEAEKAFRAATKNASERDRLVILGEFAMLLRAAKRYDQAVAIYEEANASSPTSALFGGYIGALMFAEQFERVAALQRQAERDAKDAGRSNVTLPKLLLNAAIDVAWRREDYATVARLSDARLEQEHTAGALPLTRLILSAAQAHANLDEVEQATRLVDALLTREGLSPEDRMGAAGVLLDLGHPQRAIDVAFAAVRAVPRDHDIIQAFLTIVIGVPLRRQRAGRAPGNFENVPNLEAVDSAATPEIKEQESEPPAIDQDEDDDLGSDGRTGTVGPDCFVRVRSEDGQRHDYFIYRAPPVDSLRNEYLMSDEAVADFVGMSVGDFVIRGKGWTEVRLRITRVVPAVIMVFRNYMTTYGAMFPGQQFIRAIKVVDQEGAYNFDRFFALMRESGAAAEKVLESYAKAALPLGLVAARTNRKLVELTASLATEPAKRLHVDGPGLPGAAELRSATETGTTIVLTRPALVFADALDLWDDLAARYRLIVPMAMMEEWDEELVWLAQPQGQQYPRVPQRPRRGEHAHSSPAKERTPYEESQALYARVKAVALVMRRPESALRAEDDRWRALIGASSFDAIALARSEHGVLYADDLGLRIIANREYDVQSVTTAMLLDVWRQTNQLSEDVFEEMALALVGWGHVMTPLRAATISRAFGGHDEASHTINRMLDQLADMRVSSESAAAVVTGALRTMATVTITGYSLGAIADRLAEALLRHRTIQEVGPLYLRMLGDAFRLLPTQHAEIVASTRLAIARKVASLTPGT